MKRHWKDANLPSIANARIAAIVCALILYSFLAIAPALAGEKIPCTGRQYPAKAIDVFARSARVEVDLGFGLTYRAVITLYGTVEPDKPWNEWYPKANEVLRQKLEGKPLTLCVVNEGMGAVFFPGTENVNRYMVEMGLLPPLVIKENMTTDF
jgi:hypothetical protein